MQPFSHLDTRADQEVHQHRFNLGLTGFEVISSNEHPVLHGQLDGTRDKSVLRRAVDVGTTLQYAGHCKQSGGRDFCSGLMNAVKQKKGRKKEREIMHGTECVLTFPENFFSLSS